MHAIERTTYKWIQVYLSLQQRISMDAHISKHIYTTVTFPWPQHILRCDLVYFPSHKLHQSNAATLQGMSLGPILWAEIQQSMPTQGARHDVIVATIATMKTTMIVATIATMKINIVTTTVTTSWSQNILYCVCLSKSW
jgi:hypothetical protein